MTDWKDIVLAEETGAAIAKGMEQPQQKTEPEPKSVEEELKTYVINPKVPVPIGGYHKVLDIRGTGRMQELMVKSDSSDFKVRIKVDGETLYEHSWADFNALSDTVDEVVAFEDEDGKYIVHLEDIEFKEAINILLLGIFTAEKLFLKYKLYPPRGVRYRVG